MIFQSEFPPVPELERPIADEWLEAIWRHGAEDPKRAAFIMAETGEQISFHRLYVTSLSVAAFLERAGFGRGDLAAAVLRNTWEYFAIFFGCGLRGGGLSGASPLFTNFELHQQFADSNAKLIFCMDYSLENVLKAAHECPQLQKIVVVGEQAASRAARVHDGVEIVPFSDVLRTLPTATKTVGDVDLRKDVVVMPYSSGTTGPPKGVMQGNHNYGTMLRIAFEHYDKQIARKMDPNWDWRREHLQLVLPFYHKRVAVKKNFGFTTTLLGLWGGATGVIISKYEPKIFLKTLQDYRIRLVFMVPPMILLLAKSPIVRDYDLSSVAFIQTGAAPLGHETIEMVKSRLPNLRQIGQGYGCTELSFSNHLPVCGVDVPQASGKLLSNCEMKIVDLKSGRPVGVNERGEIRIRSVIRMIGYFNRPEATREIVDSDGFLCTGDVGYVDERGLIYVVDRIKELIKVRGFQVAPAELEALFLTNPRVRDCAVFGVPHAQNGEAPRAFVVPSDPQLTVAELLEFVKERAAPYKQLHGGVEFIDAIPKSPSGKILRRQLKQKVLAKL